MTPTGEKMNYNETYKAIIEELENVYDIYIALDIDIEHVESFLVMQTNILETVDKAKSWDEHEGATPYGMS